MNRETPTATQSGTDKIVQDPIAQRRLNPHLFRTRSTSARGTFWHDLTELHEQDLKSILEQSESAFRSLDGARIFITGGTGFVGLWLLESLAYAKECLGLDVLATALTRSPKAFGEKRPHLRENFDFLEGSAETVPLPFDQFTHVIHAAPDGDALAAGARRMLGFAEQCGARFLFTSSGAVHRADCGDYALAKRIGEEETVHYKDGLVARMFTFVGPHLPLNKQFAVGNFIQSALSGWPINGRTGGSAIRSYLYASDMASWLWAILGFGRAGETYEVGSSHPITIKDLAEVIGRLASQPVIMDGQRDNGPARYLPETAKIKSELGVKETVSLEDGIQRTLRWHQGQAPRPKIHPNWSTYRSGELAHV
jgi:dTDP-glucose 4,6-dehydratase